MAGGPVGGPAGVRAASRAMVIIVALVLLALFFVGVGFGLVLIVAEGLLGIRGTDALSELRSSTAVSVVASVISVVALGIVSGRIASLGFGEILRARNVALLAVGCVATAFFIGSVDLT